jgi:hypothetical protein
MTREEAIKTLHELWRETNDSWYEEVFRMAIKALSVNAAQGEWQKVEEQPYFRKHYDIVCCSVCRKKGNRKWSFCPNCGARMKSE